MPLQLFEIDVPWDQHGDNPYPWADTPDGVFGPDGLRKTQALSRVWTAPTFVLSASAPRVDAYCCPGGYYLFSEAARGMLVAAVEHSAEWLPVEIDRVGVFFLLHPTRSVPMGPRARFRCNEVSGNIVRVDAFDFGDSIPDDARVFFPAQPRGSAAAAAGFCVHNLITCMDAARSWDSSGMRGVSFRPLPLAGASSDR